MQLAQHTQRLQLYASHWAAQSVRYRHRVPTKIVGWRSAPRFVVRRVVFVVCPAFPAHSVSLGGAQRRR